MLTRFLVPAASFVIVIAGLKAAKPIVVPFLFAIFVSIIASAPLNALRRRGVPTVLALLLVGALVAALTLAALVLFGSSLAAFLGDFPRIQMLLIERKREFFGWLESYGIDTTDTARQPFTDPDIALRFVRTMINGLSEAFGNGLLILVTVIFILLEASGFPSKLRAVLGAAAPQLERLHRIVDEVRHYMAIKTWISLFTGVLAFGLLKVLGVNYAILWGLLAFLLNYIPNIGSIIASVPPTLVALIENDIGTAVGTVVGYCFLNALIGYGIEPRWMGQGLGMSTLVVFLSLVFWGWVLGPAGMLLSVPLTMTVKIALESSDETRWIGMLLGPEREVTQEEPPPTKSGVS